jgi:hypothetical protein
MKLICVSCLLAIAFDEIGPLIFQGSWLVCVQSFFHLSEAHWQRITCMKGIADGTIEQGVD